MPDCPSVPGDGHSVKVLSAVGCQLCPGGACGGGWGEAGRRGAGHTQAAQPLWPAHLTTPKPPLAGSQNSLCLVFWFVEGGRC